MSEAEIVDAQLTLVKAIMVCVVEGSSMGVLMSGGNVNQAIRGFRAAIEKTVREEMSDGSRDAQCRPGPEGHASDSRAASDVQQRP